MTAALASCACLPWVSSVAFADQVHLRSGSVIEGKARREGDKVIVEVEAGSLTLSADSVTRIDASETEMERVDARLGRLDPNDAKGLLALADFCRERGLKTREREILQRVLKADPDHAQARARLGYVKSDAGWETYDEQKQREGYVRYNNRWLTEQQLLETRKLEAEAKKAELEEERARVSLRDEQKSRSAQPSSARETGHEAAGHAREAVQQPPAPAVVGFGYVPFGYAPYRYNGYGPPRLSPPRFIPQGMPAAPSPTPGFRDPSDMSFRVPGYQDPRNYFRP